jgi:hypothetical protein
LNRRGIDPWPLTGAEDKQSRGNDDDQLNRNRKSNFSDKQTVGHAWLSTALQRAKSI